MQRPNPVRVGPLHLVADRDAGCYGRQGMVERLQSEPDHPRKTQMLTRKTFLTAIAIAGLTAATVPAAVAQPGPGGWHHGSVLLDGVTLTDSQTTRLHALMQAGRADSQSLRDQIRTVHEQIDTALLSSGTVTEATLAPLLLQQEALAQQLDAKRLSSQVAIRNLLTPDQMAAAASMHAKLVSLHEQEHALRQQDAGASSGPAD